MQRHDLRAPHTTKRTASGSDARSGFVGREEVMGTLRVALQDAQAGRGSLVLLTGEPGIGKTRTATEIAVHAGSAGTIVLWGACYDGEWAPAYGPFAQALTTYAREADVEHLRADLGSGAAPIARVVPAIRERLPDIPEPAALHPDEERFRLFDAVGQFLSAIAARQPIVFVADDLHWAEMDTIALLRHVARLAPQRPLLLLGSYRDVELDPHNPLADTLGVLYRETPCTRVRLTGLTQPEVAQLVVQSGVPDHMRDELTGTICAVTNGNPFFVREVLQQWCEEARDPSAAGARATERLSVPDSVRQVLHRRLRHLAPEVEQLVAVAAAFNGPFHFDIAARVAGLEQSSALNAVDIALHAELIRPAVGSERYDFSHALIRETLYRDLSPSRQARAHRQIAEGIEDVYGDRAVEHAAEIAQHYFKSKDLVGAERGAPYALAAADQAEARYAYDDVARFLRIALELLPQHDPRRPRLCARLGLALAWARLFDDAAAVAVDAARAIAVTESDGAAADYLAIVLTPLWDGGFVPGVFALAEQGLRYVGDRQDMTWATLMAMDIIHQEIDAVDTPAVLLDTPERRAVTRIVTAAAATPIGYAAVPTHARIFIADARGWPWHHGDYRRAAAAGRQEALEWEDRGLLTEAAFTWANVFRSYVARGEFGRAREARDRSRALMARLPNQSVLIGQILGGEDELRMALDEGWGAELEPGDPIIGPLLTWFGAGIQSASARTCARMGQDELAMMIMPLVMPAMANPPIWMAGAGYIKVACDVVEALWLCGRAEHIVEIEREIQQRIIGSDFHHPMTDPRLALARLAALGQRWNDASTWFTRAREVLDAQGAGPLRAIVDYDEGVMYRRRNETGDAERARLLIETALQQFHAIGMPGWIRRAEQLLGEPTAAAEPVEGELGPSVATAASIPTSTTPPLAYTFRCEGDFWMIGSNAAPARMKNSKGLGYLHHLLSHPHEEFLALDLIGRTNGRTGETDTIAQSGVEVLDAASKAAYKRRIASLRADLSEAEARNDVGQVERARAEIQFIEDELSAAVGLRGRDRTNHSNAERARSTVTKGIKSAIEKLRVANPQIGRHLSRSVRTGAFCVYSPDQDDVINWQV